MARIRSRIMVVSRDVAQRARLARLLNSAGYSVEIAEDAPHARRIGFDGVAMAIVAPDGLGSDGRELIKQIRAAIDKVLLIGVRDVFDEAGLVARVAEALTPISEPEPVEPVLAFGTYHLDLAGHSLSDAAGREVSLTHGEFALLRVFLQRPGRVLSREQLLQLLSGRSAEVYDRSIDMQIVRLRRKIEPDPKHPTLIVTVPNSGYKFAATVRLVDVPEPAAPTVMPHDPERRHVTAVAAEMLAAEGSKLPEDPEELRVLIDAWRGYATAIVARHGGVMAACRVREVLAYFGYPVAQEHAAERALHAALALARREPEGETTLPVGVAVRIGVASGLVVADPSGEVLGETPAEAISMQALAQPNQVAAAASTRRLGGDLFAYHELGPFAVTGLADPVQAWQVLDSGVHASRSEALYAGAATALVGRDEELGALLRAWRLAASGKGRLMLLTGEPGIGKSRLLAALEGSLAAEPHASLHYFCSPLHHDSTLHPIVARWEREAGFARGDSPEMRLRKLEALVGPAALSSEDVAAIAVMLSVPAGNRYRGPELNARQRMDRTFAALLRRLESMVRSQPVLMLFEDAQWADPSSLELIDVLISRLAELPILLVISFRADFRAPWIGGAGTGLIALSRLNRSDSERLALQVTTERAFRREVLDRIVTKADGIPLFIEELTKALLEASADGDDVAGSLTIPATLQASLMARLDRLPTARRVGQVAAVIGREFSHTLLAAAALLPEAQLTQGLNELVDAGLVLRRGVQPDAIYTFNHALTRDVAYASLLRSSRQNCHLRIATVLKDFDVGCIDATEPELLAHHFQEGEDFSAAFAHWIMAGDVAERHGANQEAVAHYRSAQRLTEQTELPESDRARIPELLMKLGNARMQMAGYHSEEASRCYREARDLALTLDQQDEAAEAGIRMAPFLFGSCRHRDVVEIGDTILKGDTSRLRPETLVHVWVMMGGAHYHTGALKESLACSERAVELDDTVNCTHEAPWAAADPAVVARDYVEMVSRLTGDFERSLAVSEQGMAIALERGHMFSTVWASVSRVSALRCFGRYAEAIACADRAMKICEKYGFAARIGNVLLHRGPVLFEAGDQERGLADLQRGIAVWRETSGIFMLARNMTILADYQFRAGQVAQARASLAEAERLAETTEEQDYLAEIVRLRGCIWQSDGKHEQARLCYELAAARSRDQGARLFELHAARDLARLGIEVGGTAKAIRRLRAVVGQFSAGLDIPVLAECRALLHLAARTPRNTRDAPSP